MGGGINHAVIVAAVQAGCFNSGKRALCTLSGCFIFANAFGIPAILRAMFILNFKQK